MLIEIRANSKFLQFTFNPSKVPISLFIRWDINWYYTTIFQCKCTKHCTKADSKLGHRSGKNGKGKRKPNRAINYETPGQRVGTCSKFRKGVVVEWHHSVNVILLDKSYLTLISRRCGVYKALLCTSRTELLIYKLPWLVQPDFTL